jgi:hypothetical protein
MHTHRLRTGSITLHALLQTKINRQADVYFSIVLRKAACNFFVNQSFSDVWHNKGHTNLSIS